MKYYYDCPIEAAYMVKNFGIYLWEPWVEDRIKIKWDNATARLHFWTEKNFFHREYAYVHPDDEKLLEAQKGDLIGALDCNGNIACSYEPPIQSKYDKIIIRNGKSFIMPKTDKSWTESDTLEKAND